MNKKQISEMIFRLELEKQVIEAAILATKTSENRNALCDANIHLWEVLENLRKIQE